MGSGTYVDVPAQKFIGALCVGSPYTMIGEQTDQANYYATESFAITQTYIETLSDLLEGLVVPSTEDIDVPLPGFAPIDYTARPSLAGVELPGDWPVNTAVSPAWMAIPTFSEVTFPVLSVSPPSWADPDVPTMSDITEPGDLPAINPVTTPTVPILILPNPPTLEDIILPAAPTITLPVFDATLPSATIDEPAPFVWGEPNYVSDIWADLLAKVLNDLQNGGTGLDVNVEAELYQRLLDRQQDENERLYNEANDYFAARGFTAPPGALFGRITEIQAQISRNNSAASREITINQAELAQKNTHFIIEQGAKLEGMIRDFYTQGTNRMFEANKILAQNAIEIYNALINRYNLDLQKYKTESEVYEARIRAALTEIEIFKGQIEGARVSAEVQKTLVDIYEAQLRAVETQMKLYIAEMEGAKIAAELESLKLELYKLGTQAYIARLDGEKAKFSIYEIQIKAEGEKARTYGEQVRAHAIEVDATKAMIAAQISQAELVLEQNKQEVLRYQTELDAYKAELQAKLSETEAVVSGFRAEVGAYEAETHAQASMYSTQVQEIQARIEEARFNMQKAIAEVDATTKGYTALKQLQIEGTSGIMNVGAQLTASALNVVSTSLSYGYNGSESLSEGWSHGESLSESHPFKEHE